MKSRSVPARTGASVQAAPLEARAATMLLQVFAKHGVRVHKYVVHYQGGPGSVAADVVDMRKFLNDMLRGEGGR
jgi:hypothetical protein